MIEARILNTTQVELFLNRVGSVGGITGLGRRMRARCARASRLRRSFHTLRGPRAGCGNMFALQLTVDTGQSGSAMPGCPEEAP
jgi:hypothetical protein